jgi:hypothetical protein
MLAKGFTCLAVGFAAACLFQSTVSAQDITTYKRLAATFRFFGSERSTFLHPLANATGGASIYSRTITIPSATNVLFVSMHTTSDQHGGARATFACRIGTATATGIIFTPCQSGAGNPAGGAPTGWITLARHRDYNLDYLPRAGVAPFPGDARGGAGDLHDNNINYQWCIRVPFSETPYTRIVQLRMGSLGDPTSAAASSTFTVFIEGLHVFVDAGYIQDPSLRCAADLTTLPAGEESPIQQ